MSNLNQTIAPRICGDVSVLAYGSSAGFAVRERWIADPRHATGMTLTAATQKFAQKFAQLLAQTLTPGTQASSPPT